MHEKEISATRIARIIRNDVATHRRELIVSGCIIIVAYWAFSLLFWASDTGWMGPYNTIYTLFFYVFGTILTAASFSDASSLKTGVLFMALPAKVSEKFMARFLWTGIGYVLVFNILWYAASVCLSPILSLVFSKTIPLFPLIPRKIAVNISTYFLLHATSLTGAILFRKNHFLLTAAGVGIAWFMVTIFAVALNVHDVSLVFIGLSFSENIHYSMSLWKRVNMTDYLVYYGAVMPLLWVASYRLLREKGI